MFGLTGSASTCCDGVKRREFLKAGFLGLGGLSLADFLRLRAHAATPVKPTIPGKAVIFIEMTGGPSHIETYDPKPEAPPEYRGPFAATPTNVRGVYFSEAMAEQAKVMDKMAVIRSLHHDSGSHGTSRHLIQTGYYLDDRSSNENAMPSVGSYVSKLRGPNADGMPAYAAVSRSPSYGDAAYLGAGHNPFVAGGNPASDNFRVRNLSTAGDMDARRLKDRAALLGELDRTRRVADQNGVADSMDSFNQQALDLVTGERAQRAFDIEREPRKVRERYGMTRQGQSMLLARRLVEAGVTFATVRTVGWDDHNNLVRSFNNRHARVDRGIAALIQDLHERGLDKDVLVVAMGEFGRTPKINNRGPNPGRDHWGRLMSGLLAGGDLPGGTVVGASDAKGQEPIQAPYRPENVLAMVYRHLGIDPSTKIKDNTGRPQYILGERGLINELV